MDVVGAAENHLGGRDRNEDLAQLALAPLVFEGADHLERDAGDLDVRADRVFAALVEDLDDVDADDCDLVALLDVALVQVAAL